MNEVLALGAQPRLLFLAQSADAERAQLAGIRLVIAESFERIYRQNADNIGLFASALAGELVSWAALQERVRGG